MTGRSPRRGATTRGVGAGLVSLVCGISLSASVLSACGSAKPSAAAIEAQTGFVNAVHAADPLVGTYRNDTQLIRLGHAACDGFRAGASYQLLADRLAIAEGPNPLPPADLGAVITAAVDDFCPQYRSRIA